jgi:MFS transporter, DHA1 family, inner membrane transport protein
MDRRLLVLALGMFALGTDSFVVAGVLPQIAQHFNVSIGAAGQLTTAYALTYALLAPTIAALAASIPRKQLMLAALSLFVVSNLITAVAPTFSIAILSRMLAGLGAAMFSPTATGAGSMLVTPERRGFAISIIIAGLTAATALGSPAGAVIGGLGDWRWTMASYPPLVPPPCWACGASCRNCPCQRLSP